MRSEATQFSVVATNQDEISRTGRMQWSSDKTLECGVLGPRIEAYRGLVFITTTTVIYNLGYRLCSLTAVPGSTQPSVL